MLGRVSSLAAHGKQSTFSKKAKDRLFPLKSINHPVSCASRLHQRSALISIVAQSLHVQLMELSEKHPGPASSCLVAPMLIRVPHYAGLQWAPLIAKFEHALTTIASRY